MTPAQFQSIRTWFDGYVAGFVGAGDGLKPLHEMKRDHTLRVVTDAKEIAEELGWTERDVRTGEAIALLHDAGRFSQVSEFKTFSDRDSVNHAERARDVVLEAGVLDPLEPDERKCIFEGILYHNRFSVPEDILPGHVRFAQLIRDADKLDIYDVAQEAVRSGAIEKHPEIAIHVDLDLGVSGSILAEVGARKLGSYAHMKTLGDFLLVQMSWIYDLNFVPTFRRVRDRKVLERITELLPDSPEVIAVVSKVQADLAERLK